MKKKLASEIMLTEGNETILFVDDESVIIELGRELLEYLGYRVFTASGGREALEIYWEKGSEIDLVILDMIMPFMGGGETFDKLKEMNPKLKIILSSGYASGSETDSIMKRGCDGLLQKPFGLADLSHKIKEVLKK